MNTAIASDVEWIKLQHYLKVKEISTLEDEIKDVKQKEKNRGFQKGYYRV